MTRFSLVAIVAMALGILLALQPPLRAGQVALPAATPVSAAHGFTGLDRVGKPMSPLVRKTRYRCRRDCDWCRSDCYDRFRIRCWGPYCRENFTVCMRHCWDRICRWC